jgi:hypothetical protein
MEGSADSPGGEPLEPPPIQAPPAPRPGSTPASTQPPAAEEAISSPAPEAAAAPDAPYPQVTAIHTRTEFPTAAPDAEYAGARDREIEDEDEGEGLELFIDPVLVYTVAILITALGTGSFVPEVRYTLVWSGLALVGLAAVLLDAIPIERPSVRDLAVGAVYGLMIGLPLFLIGGPPLRLLSESMFAGMSDAAVFLAVAFAMPMADTLFFRGAFQAARGLVTAGLAGGIWTVILFLPALGLTQFPLVAVVIGLTFFFINFVYSMLAERVGLFSAWACQIVINVVVLWAARLGG